MSAIRSKNTSPELVVRATLHRAGFRYRLHVTALPGSPDVVVAKHHAVVLIHGCFWHLHECSLFRWPKTREEFWRQKLEGNRARDERNVQLLVGEGWRVAVVWECALRRADRRAASLDFLMQWLMGESPRLELAERNNLGEPE